MKPKLSSGSLSRLILSSHFKRKIRWCRGHKPKKLHLLLLYSSFCLAQVAAITFNTHCSCYAKELFLDSSAFTTTSKYSKMHPVWYHFSGWHCHFFHWHDAPDTFWQSLSYEAVTCKDTLVQLEKEMAHHGNPFLFNSSVLAIYELFCCSIRRWPLWKALFLKLSFK